MFEADRLTHSCEVCERLRDMTRVHYPRTRIGFVAMGIFYQVWWLSLTLPEKIALRGKGTES